MFIYTTPFDQKLKKQKFLFCECTINKLIDNLLFVCMMRGIFRSAVYTIFGFQINAISLQCVVGMYINLIIQIQSYLQVHLVVRTA